MTPPPLVPAPAKLRVLVTGSTGFIGARIIDALLDSGHEALGAARSPKPGRHSIAPFFTLDLTETDSIARVLDTARPNAVIHSAAERDMPTCEREPARATTVNLEATRHIARWCAGNAARLVFLSTDQVFDGVHGDYREEDPRRPLNVYAMTKALAEDAVLDAGPRTNTIARVALTLGHSVERTRSANEFVVSNLRAGKRVPMYANEVRTPILAHDVAIALTDLLGAAHFPRIHLAGPSVVSRFEMGTQIARAFGLDPMLLDRSTYVQPQGGLVRAENTSLNTDLAQSHLPRPPRDMASIAAFLAQTQPRD